MPDPEADRHAVLLLAGTHPCLLALDQDVRQDGQGAGWQAKRPAAGTGRLDTKMAKQNILQKKKGGGGGIIIFNNI